MTSQNIAAQKYDVKTSTKSSIGGSNLNNAQKVYPEDRANSPSSTVIVSSISSSSLDSSTDGTDSTHGTPGDIPSSISTQTNNEVVAQTNESSHLQPLKSTQSTSVTTTTTNSPKRVHFNFQATPASSSSSKHPTPNIVPSSDEDSHNSFNTTSNKSSSSLRDTNYERQLKYDALLFTWNLLTHTEWYTRYKELMIYKDIHGNVDVPMDYNDNPVLGRWCWKQRVLLMRYYEKKIAEEEQQKKKKNDGSDSMIFQLRRSKSDDGVHNTQRRKGILKNATHDGHTIRCATSSDVVECGTNSECYSLGRRVSFDELTDERVQALERLGFIGSNK